MQIHSSDGLGSGLCICGRLSAIRFSISLRQLVAPQMSVKCGKTYTVGSMCQCIPLLLPHLSLSLLASTCEGGTCQRMRPPSEGWIDNGEAAREQSSRWPQWASPVLPPSSSLHLFVPFTISKNQCHSSSFLLPVPFGMGYRSLANDEQEKRILALLMLMSRLPGDCPSSRLLVSPPLMMGPLLGVSR